MHSHPHPLSLVAIVHCLGTKNFLFIFILVFIFCLCCKNVHRLFHRSMKPKKLYIHVQREKGSHAMITLTGFSERVFNDEHAHLYYTHTAHLILDLK